jgi:putative zinc finger protein
VTMTDCQHVRQLLGVYVVGAIDPAERFVVDNHLAGCPDCREELAGLAGLPALLGRVPLEEAEQIAWIDSERPGAGERADVEPPEAEVLTPLLAKVAHRRRVSRWRSLAAVAAVVVIAAGAAIGAVRLASPPSAGSSSASSPALHWENVQATNALTHMAVKYAGMPGGTLAYVEVTGIPAGTTCQFWVIGKDGHRWPAGSWMVADEWKASSYPTVSAAPVHEVHGFQLTSGGRTLAQVRTS